MVLPVAGTAKSKKKEATGSTGFEKSQAEIPLSDLYGCEEEKPK